MQNKEKEENVHILGEEKQETIPSVLIRKSLCCWCTVQDKGSDWICKL